MPGTKPSKNITMKNLMKNLTTAILPVAVLFMFAGQLQAQTTTATLTVYEAYGPNGTTLQISTSYNSPHGLYISNIPYNYQGVEFSIEVGGGTEPGYYTARIDNGTLKYLKNGAWQTFYAKGTSGSWVTVAASGYLRFYVMFDFK